MVEDSRAILIDCLRLLLRPVVRFCLRRSIKLQDFSEAAKQVYLGVASEELKRINGEVNVSKLSVMTGLHRRDVDRLAFQDEPLRFGGDLLSRVIGQWQSDKRFSSRGKAKRLTFEGKQSEFIDLVYSVSKNLNPYTVLSELERVGAAERTLSGLKLIRQTYEPRGDVREGFSLLADDCQDFIDAVDENVSENPTIENLHSKTQYDNICAESLDTIRAWFLERGRSLHEEARRYLSQFDRDINPKLKDRPAGARVALGTFSFTEAPAETKISEHDKTRTAKKRASGTVKSEE